MTARATPKPSPGTALVVGERLTAGDAAPPVELPDTEGRQVRLDPLPDADDLAARLHAVLLRPWDLPHRVDLRKPGRTT